MQITNFIYSISSVQSCNIKWTVVVTPKKIQFRATKYIHNKQTNKKKDLQVNLWHQKIYLYSRVK